MVGHEHHTCPHPLIRETIEAESWKPSSSPRRVLGWVTRKDRHDGILVSQPPRETDDAAGAD